VKNRYEIRGEVTAIFLNSPKYGQMETIISTDKLTKAQELTGTWFPLWSKDTKSFYCYMNITVSRGKRSMVQLHRIITDCPDEMQIDHINHDTLDNTNGNIRIVTCAENLQNRRPNVYKKSNRGVYFDKSARKWRATIYVNNKRIYLGSFIDLTNAVDTVKEARLKYAKQNKGA